jgi:hypothetical protein
MTLSVSGDSITFPDLSTQLTAPSGFGFKNRIINGDMRIDQRNAGAGVTNINDGLYSLDRWQSYGSQSSKFSVQQNAAAVTPPIGFSNYLGVTSLSAYSVTASDFFRVTQMVEGFNSADLAWGTANAQTVTISFWVRSSLIGAFGGALANSAYNRSYPFNYTVSVANTWEHKTVTISGDTSGSWVGSATGIGIRVSFGLGSGSANSGTPGAWVGAGAVSATGATSVVGTSGATFYITGVQLEKGSTATAFDYLDYGRSLIQCQRYSFVASGGSGIAGAAGSSTAVPQRFALPVSMRASPTASINTAGSWGITDDYFSGYTAASFGISGSSATTDYAICSLTGFSGLTSGRAYFGSTGGTGRILFSAEL